MVEKERSKEAESINELTELPLIGQERLWVRRSFDLCFFVAVPKGEDRKGDMGGDGKGPLVLSKETSALMSERTWLGLSRADFMLLPMREVYGPE